MLVHCISRADPEAQAKPFKRYAMSEGETFFFRVSRIAIFTGETAHTAWECFGYVGMAWTATESKIATLIRSVKLNYTSPPPPLMQRFRVRSFLFKLKRLANRE